MEEDEEVFARQQEALSTKEYHSGIGRMRKEKTRTKILFC